jgi:hypothetical protein
MIVIAGRGAGVKFHPIDLCELHAHLMFAGRYDVGGKYPATSTTYETVYDPATNGARWMQPGEGHSGVSREGGPTG